MEIYDICKYSQRPETGPSFHWWMNVTLLQSEKISKAKADFHLLRHRCKAFPAKVVGRVNAKSKELRNRNLEPSDRTLLGAPGIATRSKDYLLNIASRVFLAQNRETSSLTNRHRCRLGKLPNNVQDLKQLTLYCWHQCTARQPATEHKQQWH